MVEDRRALRPSESIEEAERLFIEDFDTWDMTGYYLYSKYWRSGVSGHIDTGGTGDGLDLLHTDKQSFHVYKLESGVRLKQGYDRIAEDDKGTLWLGTVASGLHHFDPTTHRFTVYKSDPDDPNGLRDDTVPAVYVASTHLVWVGEQKGLNRLYPPTGKFVAFDSHHGFSGKH